MLRLNKGVIVICTDNSLITRINTEKNDLPSPRINLSSIEDVRRECARVYRDAKMGLIPVQDGTRLIYMLDILRKMIESNELETKLYELEETLRQKK